MTHLILNLHETSEKFNGAESLLQIKDKDFINVLHSSLVCKVFFSVLKDN
jgi:hypothetical protein